MKNYKSSIVINYGDIHNVKNDSKIIFNIINRQGTKLLIDCISEYSGNTANKFHLNNEDRKNLIENLTNELINALNERL